LDKDFVIGRHLTKPFLENKTMNVSGGLVRGRTLQRIAKRSLANMKKAFALLILMPEVVNCTSEGVEYKSGISEDEVKAKLLDLMFIELNGKDDIVILDDDTDIPNDNPQKMPDDMMYRYIDVGDED
jgi:hypothetical protein